MISYNHVIIIGNLTRDPDIRTINNAGMKLARLSVCVNEKRKTSDGKVIENHLFVDVDAWARLAEMCEKYLAKNSNVFVEGRLQMAQWEKDGVRHQKLKIRAHNIKFLPKSDRFNGGGYKTNAKTDTYRKNPKSYDADDSQDAFIPEDTGDDNQIEGFESAISGW